MHTGKSRVFIAAGVVFCTLTAATAHAQCTNVGGGAPTNEPNLTYKVVLQPGPGGIWGNGNDRFRVLKGIVNLGVAFDPSLVHNLTLTQRVNTVGGLLVSTVTIPVGAPGVAPGWSVSGTTWDYLDTAAVKVYGVHRIRIRDMGGGQLLIVRILGRDVSNTNAPLGANDLHEMLEIYDAFNVGICVDSTLTTCNIAGTVCRP